MISKYKYVFFDVDGVLLSSIDYYIKFFREMAESLGAPGTVPDEYYKKHIGVKLDVWMNQILPKERHHQIFPTFLEKSKTISEANHFVLVEGAKNTLRKIKENHQKTCLISSKTRASMNSFIAGWSLEEHIDFSVSGDDVTHFKPDPQGILKSLEYFGARPAEAVFIGDSLHDLGAARNANLNFNGVLSGVCTQKDWEVEGVHYVHSIKDLHV